MLPSATSLGEAHRLSSRDSSGEFLCSLQVVDPSTVRGEITRRGSMKRGSISWDEEGDLEAKKLKAALDAMGMLKKKQKEFTWDAVNSASSDETNKNLETGRMTKDQALKTLGLVQTAQTKGGKVNKPKNATDYSEDEITLAFQRESKSLSKKKCCFVSVKSKCFPASQGKVRELQTCHEAYQVLSKVIRAKNSFLKKTKAKKQVRIMEQTSVVWEKRNLLDLP